MLGAPLAEPAHSLSADIEAPGGIAEVGQNAFKPVEARIES
jgi:hypothetical protein